jgi:hypothetical protein
MKKQLIKSLVVGVSLLISSCDGPNSSTSENQPDVESVVWDTAISVVTPGTYELAAHTLPEAANQEIRFTIQGNPISGVGITDKTMTIALSAPDEAVFNVMATSIYDPSIKTPKAFTISNAGIDANQLSTEADLMALAANEDGWDDAYVLTNDIALSSPWPMIGIADFEDDFGNVTPGTPFNGIFDGCGYKISGINVTNASGPVFNGGFFAQIGSTGIVENVEFEGAVTANGWSGGVAGINAGTIRNVISNVSVTVSGTSAGGLVSVNRGIVEYSYAIGLVKSLTNANNLGRSAGLIVSNESVVTEIYGDKDTMETPNYLSFAPTQDPRYMLSTAQMKLAATWESFDEDIWFIADGTYPLLKYEGFVPPHIDLEPAIVITNTDDELDLLVDESLTVTIQLYNYGGEDIVYTLLNPIPEGVTMVANIVHFNLESVPHDFSFTVEARIGTTDYYATKAFHAVYSPVVEEDTIRIETTQELVDLLSGQQNSINLSKTYLLENDIALTSPWNPIGVVENPDEAVVGIPFSGTFDGQGHTISGFSITSGFHKGFFGQIGETGIVENLHLEGAMSVSGWSAGLAVVNYGLITNCHVEVNVSGNSAVAALVRNNYGTISYVIQEGLCSSSLALTASRSACLILINSGTLNNVIASLAELQSNNLTGWEPTLDDGTHILADADFNSPSKYSAFDGTIWDLTILDSHPLLIAK